MSKKNQKILLVQPHSDDVLFSASKYLFEAEKYSDVIILTVENDEKRILEDKELCELFGVKHITLNTNFKDESYYYYYKDNKKKIFSFSDCIETLENCIGNSELEEISKKLLIKVLKFKNKGYKIITCLGVGHPMHYFVRKTLEPYTDLFYRDFPHSFKRKTANCIENEINKFKLNSEFTLSENQHEIKWEIAYRVYKSQRSLLFFEKGYIDKKITEQFYTLK